jgi:hypothetical protein
MIDKEPALYESTDGHNGDAVSLQSEPLFTHTESLSSKKATGCLSVAHVVYIMKLVTTELRCSFSS